MTIKEIDKIIERSFDFLKTIKDGDHVKIYDQHQVLHTVAFIGDEGSIFGQLGLIYWDYEFCLKEYPEDFRILGVYKTEDEYYDSYK